MSRISYRPVSCAALVIFCSSCVNEEERAQRELEDKADKDARRAKVKAAVCKDETGAMFQPVVFRFAEDEETENLAVVYAKPDLWSALNIDQRLVFAGWAAECIRGKDMLSIRDGNSGETLTTWSLDGGLR